LSALAQFERARHLHEDTLARRRRLLGEDHPDVLGSTYNLARDLHALGEYKRARQVEDRIRSQRES
jgi:Tetratricopeptide repeat